MKGEDQVIPRWVGRFLQLICPEHLLEEIEGDLIYRYNKDLLKHNNSKAKRRLVWNAIRFFRPGILMRNNFTKGLNYQIMLKYHLLVAWRVLLKNKLFSFTNVSGLAIGFACCTLIALYVMDELSYDLYHSKANQIYRVLHYYDNSKDTTQFSKDPKDYQVWGNAPVGPALQADFPEVEKVVRFSGRINTLIRRGDKVFNEENIFLVDSTVFDVFGWEFATGSPEKALESPNSIVITESTARKYFGDENAIGETLTVDAAAGRINDTGSYMVTGVLKDIPANSHFTFDVLLPMSQFKKSRPGVFPQWGYVDFYTYFLVPRGYEISRLQAKMEGFSRRHVPDFRYHVMLEPLTDAYLHSDAKRQPGVTGNLSNLYIFSAIAVFILFIACINFMNLSTARSLTRAKEVGVRKVAGARQTVLRTQFLTEAVLLSVMAGFLALLITMLLLPSFRELTGKQISYEAVLAPQILLSLFAITIVSGLFAGVYPALVLSSFHPSQVLKGIFKASFQGAMIRKGLVVFQFTLSIALIAGTGIVFSQLNHLRTVDLGFEQDQMLVINYGYDGKVEEQIDMIKNEFEQHPAVLSAAASRTVPGGYFPKAGTNVESSTGEMEHQAPDIYEIDYDFIEHFGIELVAGRSYSRDFPADTARSLVINEAAARLWGYPDPEEAIGKKFEQWGREGRIIGVVKDFNYISLHNRIEPLTLRLEPKYSTSFLTLKLKPENLPATVKELEEKWTTLAPHRPFLYSFLDDSFNRQYQADLRFGKVFGVFAILAIFIACLGLFGLAAWTAERRIKEIGIRRVLGASFSQIISLLSADFMKLVLVSILIATPLGWYVMSRWLESFAYQVDMQWWIFAFAGLMAAAIALVTVSFQSVKAASMNPARSLRSE
ncbi:ABC transporter permease [Imperialibacter roseus]|uniref:ABC transporter permease n=1 Tax=Imperialibacter roseus TaxID=1324217 RepID=A0ABZ0IQK4_9BACT|nr:ABC transporter permease [Imperialibacter roseus]WOK06265.1 ABC transporter permease [Imperialibacter roseus]